MAEPEPKVSIALLERLPVGLLRVGSVLTLTGANPAAAALLGKSVPLVGRPLEQVLPSPPLVQAVREALASGAASRPYSLEFEVQGELGRCSVRATVLGRQVGPDGAVEAVVSVEDATAEATLMEKVFSSELRFQVLVGEATDAILVVDAAGCIRYGNGAAERSFNVPYGNLVGERLEAFVSGATWEVIRRRLQGGAADTAGTPDSGVWVVEAVREGDGAFPAEVTVAEHWLDDAPVHVVTLRDLTERRAAEAALQRSNDEFRSLIELTPDAVAVLSDGVIVYANPALHALVAAAPGSLVGSEAAGIVVPEERPGFPPWLEVAPATSSAPGLHEAHWLKRDGTVVAVERRLLPLVFQGLPAWLVVARDLSRDRALAERTSQLDQMIAVGTLAAGVGHEINNPMAYVISNLAQAAQGLQGLGESLQPAPCAPSDEVAALREQVRVTQARLAELQGVVADAREGADRVRRIVMGLRTFTQTAASTRVATQVGDLLDAATAVSWEDLRHRATVVRDYADTPKVLVDEERMRQVFISLISNAARAMPARSSTPGELRLRTFRDGAQVVVEVEDTGGGMAPDVLRRAFDPFFTTRPVGQGMGLGLFIVKATVEAQGGRVSVHSEPGLGTTFRVVLPAAEAPSAGAAPVLGRGRVLLVDDEVNIRTSLTRALALRHEVVSVSGGQEALELLARGERFDAVLLDVMMPRMSGVELLGRLQVDYPELSSRVVLMSGGVASDRAGELLRHVANPMLEKPFDTRLMLETVGRCVRASGGPGAPA